MKYTLDETRAILIRWSQHVKSDKWTIRRMLGYGQPTIAKFMAGLPRTTCHDCRGSKKVLLPVIRGKTIRTEYVDCPMCSGQGFVNGKSTKTKVNPAYILSTRIVDADSLMLDVERIVNRLPRKQKRAVMIEYVKMPNSLQYDRARRMGCTERHYRRVLASAEDKIMAGLNVEMPK